MIWNAKDVYGQATRILVSRPRRDVCSYQVAKLFVRLFESASHDSLLRHFKNCFRNQRRQAGNIHVRRGRDGSFDAQNDVEQDTRATAWKSRATSVWRSGEVILRCATSATTAEDERLPQINPPKQVLSSITFVNVGRGPPRVSLVPIFAPEYGWAVRRVVKRDSFLSHSVSMDEKESFPETKSSRIRKMAWKASASMSFLTESETGTFLTLDLFLDFTLVCKNLSINFFDFSLDQSVKHGFLRTGRSLPITKHVCNIHTAAWKCGGLPGPARKVSRAGPLRAFCRERRLYTAPWTNKPPPVEQLYRALDERDDEIEHLRRMLAERRHTSGGGGGTPRQSRSSRPPVYQRAAMNLYASAKPAVGYDIVYCTPSCIVHVHHGSSVVYCTAEGVMYCLSVYQRKDIVRLCIVALLSVVYSSRPPVYQRAVRNLYASAKPGSS